MLTTFKLNARISNVQRMYHNAAAIAFYLTNLILSISNHTWSISIRNRVFKWFFFQNSTVNWISLNNIRAMQNGNIVTGSSSEAILKKNLILSLDSIPLKTMQLCVLFFFCLTLMATTTDLQLILSVLWMPTITDKLHSPQENTTITRHFLLVYLMDLRKLTCLYKNLLFRFLFLFPSCQYIF